jgi:hypothetical protein
MFRGLRNSLAATLVAMVAMQTAIAAEPTFSELLDRAQAQEAAGHILSPTGDNMTDTVVALLDLLPSATPDQLAKFNHLLERGKQALRADLSQSATGDAAPSDALPAPTSAAPMPSVMSALANPPPVVLIAAPDSPSEGTAPATMAPLSSAGGTTHVQGRRHHKSHCSSHHPHGHCH